jgi:hypothetical protein
METMAKNNAVRNAVSCLQGSSSSSGSCGVIERGIEKVPQARRQQRMIPSWDRLLGRDYTTAIFSNEEAKDTQNVLLLSESDVLPIIRRNAFGPDFVTNERVQQKWMEYMNNTNESNKNNLERKNSMVNNMFRPSRLLGLYPIAAMLNHSCIPNAVRVYIVTPPSQSSTKQPPPREYMIVHACQKIRPGEEIVWSYIPVIQTYPQRQSVLQQTHGFVCDCRRCQMEQTIWQETKQLHSLSNLIRQQLQNLMENETATKTSTPDELLPPPPAASCFFSVYAPAVSELENEILNHCDAIKWTNEMKRYVRVGFLECYMEYLNGALYWLLSPTQLPKPSIDDSSTSRIPTRADLLSLCTQLHFSLAACHNASTEHLSVRAF